MFTVPATPPAAPVTSPSLSLPPGRVVVRFAAGAGPPYVDGAEDQLTGASGSDWSSIAHDFPGIHLDRLFTAVAPARLDELVARGRLINPKYDGVDLKTFFAVEVPVGKDEEDLAARLRGMQGVELAYVESPPQPPPAVTPYDDTEIATQSYLEPAPTGIGALAVWNVVPGAAGDGIRVVDIEQGWALNHEDLPLVSSVWGLNKDYMSHGTSVLGILIAMDNDRGCIGVAPSASGGVASIYPTSGGLANRSDALLASIDWLKYGDVLLVEDNVSVTVGTVDWDTIPVEAEAANFELIRLATALGIVVVEAAGNASRDLDQFNPGGLYPFLRNSAIQAFKDSGAIIVAAAVPTGGAPVSYARRNNSNFGSRIDCFAHGEKVGTIGDPGGKRQPVPTDPTNLYNPAFSGTSAAAAIVAGAALSLQGMVQAASGHRLSALQVRKVLSDDLLGTPSASGRLQDRIGVMPNLEKASRVLPDIVIRDFPGDTGDPHNGPLATSPDIIVRSASVTYSNQSFGQGSGTENDPDLSDSVTAGQNHYIYVRVKNRGGPGGAGAANAANVRAEVYYSVPSSLVQPDQWQLIGSTTIGAVPADNTLRVSPAIVWPAASIPAAGHYCFVALVGDDLDPMPFRPDLGSDWDTFLRLIRDVNNVTWRNFNVVEMSAGASPAGAAAAGPVDGGLEGAGAPADGEAELEFLLVGAADRARVMSLELLSIPATGCRLTLDAPPEVLGAARVLRLRPLLERLANAFGRTPPLPVGRMRVDRFPFPAGFRAKCRLSVRLSGSARLRPVDVIVRQLDGKQEVGRITWRLKPRR